MTSVDWLAGKRYFLQCISSSFHLAFLLLILLLLLLLLILILILIIIIISLNIIIIIIIIIFLFLLARRSLIFSLLLLRYSQH